ncbi:hypothetical protein [Photobacterium damselae]|uniref:hypothetical protein n=1 Tax=Photobacterium damselae TaxID=38293 RepID=UPI001F2B3BC3|nr:hypothetical protein [Photobacterium damselae]UKA12678.1 hypothetical protein IHC91_17375 [Photobacterium damselae subsp. damselae]
MSDKIAIVYVGPKKIKRDTICGTRIVFPQFEPVPVAVDIAYQLTEYSTVWKYAHQVQQHLDELNEKQQAKEQEEQKTQEQALIDAFEKSMVVTLSGDDIDLAKLTETQLKTLVEAEDLILDPKGATEKVGDYRVRVRDAIRALSPSSDDATKE